MGWLIVLAILVLLAVLPLGVSVKYDEGGLMAWLTVGPLRFALYPRPEKKEKKPKKKTAGEKKTAKPEEKIGGKLSDFRPLLGTALDFLKDLRRKIRVKRLEMKLILAGDDPCDLAENYGRAWAALGNLIPALERGLKIKKRDLQVECDFTADQIRIYARGDVTITFGRLLCLGGRYGLRAVKQLLKNQKGGAEK